MRELRPGLWRWTARHPDWTPEEGGPEGWEPEVASYLYEAPGALVLFDPLSPSWDDLDDRVARLGPPNVLITIFWHTRSADEILDRYAGTRVFAHENALPEVRKRVAATDTFTAGDTLPGGVEAMTARDREALFWLPDHAALVAGDVLLGRAGGGVRVCPDSWLSEKFTPEGLREELRAAVLDRPVELILLTHGEPVVENARAALDEALVS
jgi:glyoxylase-like metal-dependent hydrolase (beta-lactamase superfamily II)